jgi:TolB protein
VLATIILVASVVRAQPTGGVVQTRIENRAGPQQREFTFYQDLAWSPDGSRIAYSVMKVSRSRWEKESYAALSGADFEIYVMDADGTHHRRMTNNPGYDLWLSWAPDSRRVVFSSERKGNTGLYVMNADGSGVHVLTTESGKESAPAWSPDGKRIAYASKQDEHWQLWVMNHDGSAKQQLTTEPGDHLNPVWSPDGRMLAYYSNRAGRDQVFTITVESNEPGRAITDGVFPAWAPNGRGLIHGRADKLYLVSPGGSNQRLLAEKSEFGRFSPDGSRIAFVMGSFPDTEIFVMEANGTRRRQLTHWANVARPPGGER